MGAVHAMWYRHFMVLQINPRPVPHELFAAAVQLVTVSPSQTALRSLQLPPRLQWLLQHDAF